MKRIRSIGRGPSAVLALLVFGVGAAFTFVVSARWQRNLETIDRARFNQLTDRTAEVVQSRVRNVGRAVQGAKDFVYTRDGVSTEEWVRVAQTANQESGGALIGLGLIKRIKRSEIDSYETARWEEGRSDFRVERGGTDNWLYVVTQSSPLPRTARELGRDFAADPMRRAVAVSAARNDQTTLSPQLNVTDGDRDIPGFLLVTPVYRRNVTLGTPDSREALLRCLLYASIEIDSLAPVLLRTAEGQLDVALYQTERVDRAGLIFDSTRFQPGRAAKAVEGFTHQVTIEFYGRNWLLTMKARPEFFAASGGNFENVALGAGLFISLLAAGLLWSLLDARARAVRLAAEMTEGLIRTQAEVKRLASIASQTASSVIILGDDWHIEWVNDSFTRIFGYTLAEVKGRCVSEVLDGPKTSEEGKKAILEAGRTGQTYRGEVVNYTKDQRALWIQTEVQVLLDDDGKRVGHMALQLDITAQKKAAEEIHAAKEAAEQANRAKSQFLAMMSHEIRTPMNGVIGMTSLLLDSPLTPAQRDYADTIRHSGDALLTIINDILDFSKIESGRMELEIEAFSLRDCVEGALDLLAPKAAEKGIDLLYEIADAAPGYVRGDSTRLRQILVNLLGNAVKFTASGEVALSVQSRLVAGDDRIELTFAVTDTGLGIPEEAIGRLFQSFSQVDASTTRKFGGTGLGLAISKRLAELMGGGMSVQSEIGRGSTFSFTIQVGVVPNKPRPYVGATRPSLAGKRLLVVDDNATSRRILTTLAAKWEMTSTAVESGPIALALLQGDQMFDVAILDMHMPEMDGVMLAEKIRTDARLSKLPLILLSSLGQHEGSQGAAVFAARLTKPAKPAQIFETLLGLFAGEMPIPEVTVVSSLAVPETISQAEHILLAEDNTVNQRVALHMLAKLGYRADLASNGLEAIQSIERQSYDIVLMDVQMPEMDGLEASRRIGEKFLGREGRPWIVALTANAMQGDRERCLEAGMDDYISKPIKVNELLAALERARVARAARV